MAFGFSLQETAATATANQAKVSHLYIKTDKWFGLCTLLTVRLEGSDTEVGVDSMTG